MQALELLWPILLGGLITPVVSWVSSKLPTDFPVKPVLISASISIGVVFGLSRLFVPDWSWAEIIAYALASHTASQITHEVTK